MVFEQLPPLLVLNHIIFFIQLNLHLCYYREGKVPKKVPNSNTNLEPYRFKREPDPTLLTTQRPQWYSHFTALHVLSKPQSNDSFLLQVTLNTQRSSLHRDHNLILTLSTSDTRAETTVSEKISVDLLEMKCTPKKKNHTRGPLRFSVHITEPVTDVVHTVMSLADVSMICPIRDVSELAFLQVSQKSAQFFKAFLVLCGSTSAEQEL